MINNRTRAPFGCMIRMRELKITFYVTSGLRARSYRCRPDASC